MSHITIIISKAVVPGNGEPQNHAAADVPTYDYRMPVPHDASPADVAQMVREAYRRLEKKDD